MDRVARLPADEREELFHETASARGLTDRIVEKDFWVCWTLKHLFGLEELPSLLFKGGTSLSKAFHAIARFSEDVDLSIDRHALGFDDHELNALSPNQIQKRIKKLQRKCTMLVNDTIRSRLEEDFATVIGPAGVEWQLCAAEDDADDATLLFSYPKSIEDESSLSLDDHYVEEVVRLEFGARSDHWPYSDETIKPYAAEDFPDVFRNASVRVRALRPERTFWDKVTILHRIARMPEERPIKPRQSRHYVQLYNSQIGVDALADRSLLRDVVRHTSVFFPRQGVNCDELLTGQAPLVPPNNRQRELASDYRETQRVLFTSDAPPWEEVISQISELEQRITKPASIEG